MPTGQTLTFCLMDGPFEQARTVTAFRLMDAAIRRGADVQVFAYEGAVGLAFARQNKHANAVHGHDEAEEDHPLPREWIRSLQDAAQTAGTRFEWINCGLCVDERGMDEAVEGTRRGSPADLWKWAVQSTGTLIIGTR